MQRRFSGSKENTGISIEKFDHQRIPISFDREINIRRLCISKEDTGIKIWV